MAAQPTVGGGFPNLRLRRTGSILDLPWERPLRRWPASLGFRHLPVGPSRHLVRFVAVDDVLLACKEEPTELAEREYGVLVHLERLGLPAVRAVALAVQPTTGNAILVTEYLTHSLQFRRLLSRLPITAGAYRERLLNAIAWLMVDVHRAGVFWGDCSLANTLFRRDGDRIQAYLVDAETSEVHPTLSDGLREQDLELLVENLGYGLADVARVQDRMGGDDEAIELAEACRDRYLAIWEELHLAPEIAVGDRHAIRRRLRRLNDLGFAVDEISVTPAASGSRMLVHLTLSNRDYHANELKRLTGITALEGQATLLLNDVREFVASLPAGDSPGLSLEAGARRWLAEVLEPTLSRIRPAITPGRDLLQAYCDVLEHKWLLSERAGRDVGLDAAVAAYIADGAPAPEPAFGVRASGS